MTKFFFALIIIVPALEIGLLMLSGKTMGITLTIILIILTGVLGAWLAKRQGLETIKKAQEQMRFGQVPGEAIVDGLCILVGGVVLLTPGFITDAVGFMLLFPMTRKAVKPFFFKMIRRMMEKGRYTIIK